MIKLFKKVMVHAYKRNGWLYRVWEFPQIIEITNDYICLSLINSKIITSDKDSKRNFHSINNKNTFWFFFKNEWFNVLASMPHAKSDHVEYYVNIASPFIYEEDAFKYYDFDLDIKMKSNSNSKYKILDLNEYEFNKKAYEYDARLQQKILQNLELFKSSEFRQKIFDLISVEKLNQLQNIKDDKNKLKYKKVNRDNE